MTETAQHRTSEAANSGGTGGAGGAGGAGAAGQERPAIQAAQRRAEAMQFPLGLPDVRRRPPIGVRLFEIFIAGSALLILAPVLLVVMAIIKLDSPGAVLFRQDRLGVDGKPFRFGKFRTLYVDAKERFPELYEYKFSPDQLEKGLFKTEDDPRITKAGQWLRKSTLDELPNLWNVLKGDMALVGPRPDIPEMLQYVKGEYLAKYSVRPGVTGLYQVSGRANLSFYEMLEYDIEYVRRQSFWFDLKILFKTAKCCLFRDGAF